MNAAKPEERLTGTWRLPTQPNLRRAGVLVLSGAEEARLEIDRALPMAPRRSHADTPETYEIVLGRAGSRLFTLYRCMVESEESVGRRETRQVLSIDTAFEGARIASADDLTFDAAAIGIEPLHDWAKWSTTSGRIIRRSDVEDGRLVRTHLTYEPQAELRAATDQGEIVLAEGLSIPRQRGRAELNTSHTFRMQLSSPLPFESWHTAVLRPLQNFVSLVTDQAARITWVTMSHSAHLTGPRGRRYPAPIKVRSHFLQQIGGQPRRLVSTDFLIGFDEMANRFEPVMREWFRISRDYRDACTLMFAPRYAGNLYLESSFLMIAQALEVFHRTKYATATIMPPNEYEALRGKLLAATPKEHRSLIASRLSLSHGNAPFFKDRLLDLIELAGESVTNLVKSRDAWAKKLKDTRNDLTHWSDTREGVEPGTEAFFRLLRQATILTKAIALREIGFSTSECARLFSENWLYRFSRGQI